MAPHNLLNDGGELKPFVRFERVAVEDPIASRELGHYAAKDVDMANITPPYSKDVLKHKVANWFAQLEVDVANGRMPAQWLKDYKNAYEAWKNGQELPLDGIPIKGWGVASPAQQETLIKMHILTVEQLAAVTHEGISRIGMGGVDLKNKADAWLKSLKKSGGVAIEIAALKKENDSLNATVENQNVQLAELTKLVEQLAAAQPVQAGSHMGAVLGISADELMDDD